VSTRIRSIILVAAGCELGLALAERSATCGSLGCLDLALCVAVGVAAPARRGLIRWLLGIRLVATAAQLWLSSRPLTERLVSEGPSVLTLAILLAVVLIPRGRRSPTVTPPPRRQLSEQPTSVFRQPSRGLTPTIDLYLPDELTPTTDPTGLTA
jgi:hypothetical protein